VQFKDGAAKTNQIKVQVRGVESFTERARVGDKRVYRQKAVGKPPKPGPKPKHGFTMPPDLRKAVQRARENGLPVLLDREAQDRALDAFEDWADAPVDCRSYGAGRARRYRIQRSY
jgi:hypothetical protein